MLQIALCDDEPDQLAQLDALLRDYLTHRPDLSARLTAFSSPEELLDHPEPFDLYLLDVVMPGLSGIDLGLRLRRQGRDGAIIYLTVSRDFAVDSYLVSALHYLLKPLRPDRLYDALDRAVAQLRRRRAASLQVKTKTGLRLLPLDDIFYVELLGRSARYHLARGEPLDSVTFHTSFQKEMAPLLADSRFALCGSSFVVNLHYVTAVEKAQLTLAGGGRVPLSRGYYQQVKLRWGNYWMDREDALCKN